jgi:WD40 repeat protein
MVANSVEYATEYGRPHSFLHDGQIAIPSKGGIRIVDASKGTTVHRLLLKLDGEASAVGAAGGIPLMAIGTSKGSLLLAATRGAPATRVLSQIHNGAILTIAFTPNDQWLVSGGVDGAIRLVDAKTGHPMQTAWAAHFHAVTALGISPDGKYVASGSAGGTIRVWNVATGLPVTHELVGHAAPVVAIMFDKSAGQVVSVGGDGKLRRWAIPL